jgi:hypothetical protein
MPKNNLFVLVEEEEIEKDRRFSYANSWFKVELVRELYPGLNQHMPSVP